MAHLLEGLSKGERVAMYRDARPVLMGVVMDVNPEVGVLILTTVEKPNEPPVLEQVLVKPELLALPGIEFEVLGRLH